MKGRSTKAQMYCWQCRWFEPAEMDPESCQMAWCDSPDSKTLDPPRGFIDEDWRACPCFESTPRPQSNRLVQIHSSHRHAKRTQGPEALILRVLLVVILFIDGAKLISNELGVDLVHTRPCSCSVVLRPADGLKQ